MAAGILTRLSRSRAVQERVAYLVQNHLRLTMAPRMRTSTLKRMLAEDGFDELLESPMDALASSSYLGLYHFCRHAMTTMTAAEMRPPRLIGGDDLILLGFTPGPRFKNILKEVEDLQLDGDSKPAKPRSNTSASLPAYRRLRLLRAIAITKRFGRTLALDGVDFEACPGEIHALVGKTARARPP